ncbi:hypothetical protein T09_10315 [Trichinella sp. T9]|uniref:Uncharacterized protein n=1 Tax=Trichinella murrelli TaxID=144512 RepID=A0A0V0T8Z4_9BILA|nr:hypothetical protein T05_14898 [Trichinella murrelli]KRX56826.1 hypothetical protein T09_10315 [Trichinella sp. T9]
MDSPLVYLKKYAITDDSVLESFSEQMEFCTKLYSYLFILANSHLRRAINQIINESSTAWNKCS